MKVPLCPFRVFLCHASTDRKAAELLSASLEVQGHDVFLSEDDLPPGKTFVDRISAKLRRSHLFIFLVSPSSVESGRYTLTELKQAQMKWKRSKDRVLPVM
ncbi:MAG: toll/interleukin-1 receptor domain-containing protein, partial [bacterium]|nr:toll/interleukin-1 receptor domain-containing protein [bacterium]